MTTPCVKTEYSQQRYAHKMAEDSNLRSITEAVHLSDLDWLKLLEEIGPLRGSNSSSKVEVVQRKSLPAGGPRSRRRRSMPTIPCLTSTFTSVGKVQAETDLMRRHRDLLELVLGKRHGALSKHSRLLLQDCMIEVYHFSDVSTVVDFQIHYPVNFQAPMAPLSFREGLLIDTSFVLPASFNFPTVITVSCFFFSVMRRLVLDGEPACWHRRPLRDRPP